MNEFIIEKLTTLLIELDLKEKETGKEIYVRKTQCYKDLIKFFKEWEVKE